MRYLVTVVALGLCACGSADNIVSADATSATSARSSTSVTSSVNSTSSNTSVTSSTNVGSTTTATNATTSCSADNDGKRCEVSCRSPQVAQCLKSVSAAEPRCVCKQP